MGSQAMLIDLEEEIPKSEMAYYAKLLYRSYNISLNDNQLWNIISDSFHNKFDDILNKYSPHIIANDIVNKLILKYVPAERTIKYHFIKELIRRRDEVTLFELAVQNSRIDLCRMNGKSNAYEIKTEIDDLTRLPKQLEDYSGVFEYVYVITAKAHYEDVLLTSPDHCGVICYSLVDDKCVFSYRRKATKSEFIDPLKQLETLSSKDLYQILRSKQKGVIPSTKEERIKLLLQSHNSRQINLLFKQSIKHKYYNQWNFLKTNFSKIYPIDIQSFFQNTIEPELIYYKSEC